MKKPLYSALLLVGLLFFSLLAAPAAASSPLKELAGLFAGTYSTADMARQNPGFDDVRLHIVPIFPNEKSAYWFYLEQAYATAPDKPYRQTIVKLTDTRDGRIECWNYGLHNKTDYLNAWNDPARLARLSRADVDESKTCVLVFKRTGPEIFEGGTTPAGCASTYKGAVKMTNVTRLTKTEYVMWDRGWDGENHQVWGPKDQGYRFTRLMESVRK